MKFSERTRPAYAPLIIASSMSAFSCVVADAACLARRVERVAPVGQERRGAGASIMGRGISDAAGIAGLPLPDVWSGFRGFR